MSKVDTQQNLLINKPALGRRFQLGTLMDVCMDIIPEGEKF